MAMLLEYFTEAMEFLFGSSPETPIYQPDGDGTYQTWEEITEGNEISETSCATNVNLSSTKCVDVNAAPSQMPSTYVHSPIGALEYTATTNGQLMTDGGGIEEVTGRSQAVSSENATNHPLYDSKNRPQTDNNNNDNGCEAFSVCAPSDQLHSLPEVGCTFISLPCFVSVLDLRSDIAAASPPGALPAMECAVKAMEDIAIATAPGTQQVLEHAVATMEDNEKVGVVTICGMKTEVNENKERMAIPVWDGSQENLQDGTLLCQQWQCTEGIKQIQNVSEPSLTGCSDYMNVGEGRDQLQTMKLPSEIKEESQYLLLDLNVQNCMGETPVQSADEITSETWDCSESTDVTTATGWNPLESPDGVAVACQQHNLQEQDTTLAHPIASSASPSMITAQKHASPPFVTNETALVNTSGNMQQTVTSGEYAKEDLTYAATLACMQMPLDQFANKSMSGCNMEAEVADAAKIKSNITLERVYGCAAIAQQNAPQPSVVSVVPLPVVEITTNSDTNHELIPATVDAFNTSSSKATGMIEYRDTNYEQVSYTADSFNASSTETIAYRDASCPPIPLSVNFVESSEMAKLFKAADKKMRNKISSKMYRFEKKNEMTALNEEYQRKVKQNNDLMKIKQKLIVKRQKMRFLLPSHLLKQIYDRMLADGYDVVPDNIPSLLMENRQERGSMSQCSSSEKLMSACDETSQLPTPIHNNHTQGSQRLAPISTLISNNTTLPTVTSPAVDTDNQYSVINVTPSSGQLVPAFPVSMTQQLIVVNMTQGYRQLIPRTAVNNMPPGSHQLAPMPIPYNMTQLTDNPTLYNHLLMLQGIQEMEMEVMPLDDLMMSDID